MPDKLAKLLAEMRRNPNNVRFADLLFVCRQFFGEPRSQGTSHYVFKMPWPGDRESTSRTRAARRSRTRSSRF